MGKKELIKRYALFIVSLFVSALGVAITKKGELGVSPISSVGNVMSLKFSAVSLGKWLIIWNCLLILGQIVLLRRKFKLIQLLQIPLSFLFGYFTDFGMWLVSFIHPQNYASRLGLVILGTIILGIGVSLAVIANVIMNSGEAFVSALSQTINKEFSSVKIIFDVSCVVISVILSMFFFNFSVQGTREGTIIAALCTGFVVKICCKLSKERIDKVLCG